MKYALALTLLIPSLSMASGISKVEEDHLISAVRDSRVLTNYIDSVEQEYGVYCDPLSIILKDAENFTAATACRSKGTWTYRVAIVGEIVPEFAVVIKSINATYK